MKHRPGEMRRTAVGRNAAAPVILTVLLTAAAAGQTPSCLETGFSQETQWSGPSFLSVGHKIAVGDFDGDGDDDLALSEAYTPAGFRVFRGGRERIYGGLTPNVSPRVYGPGGAILAVDFNGDEVDDLILEGDRGRCVAIISQGQTLRFERGPDVGCQPESFAKADLDRNGFVDIVSWLRPSFTSSTFFVDVALNDGVGGVQWLIPSTPSPLSYANADVGDIDADGYPDLVIAGFSTDSYKYPKALNRSLIAMRGVGDGQFDSVDEGRGARLLGIPESVLARDVTQDGYADAIVVVDNRLEVYRGGPGPRFAADPISSSPLPFPGTRLRSGDFNGDGFLDVVVNPWGSAEVRQYAIFLGDGRGKLELDHTFSLKPRKHDYPWEVEAGDFNADGRLDLAAVERFEDDEGAVQVGILVLQNSCPARVTVELDQRAVRPGGRASYRARIRNISDQPLQGVRATSIPGEGLIDQGGRLDAGTACDDSDGCEIGKLAPGEERFADFEVLVDSESDLLSAERMSQVKFVWEGGQAVSREVIQVAHGPDLVVTAEMIGEPALGAELRFLASFANRGVDRATDVQISLIYSVLGVQRELCRFSATGQCVLGDIEPGAAIQREFSVALPTDEDATSFSLVISFASPSLLVHWGNSISFGGFLASAQNLPFQHTFSTLEGWAPAPGLVYEVFNSRLRVASTGSVRRRVPGLTPGQTYSVRALGGADRQAEPRAAVRAYDSRGVQLAAAGPYEVERREVLQTLVVAPSDGVIDIELFSEINRDAVTLGELAGVVWERIEVLPAAPKTLQVPEDFASIQDAIEASSDGDTISVGPGTYRELLDLGSRAIVLESRQGPQTTIVDAGSDGAGLTIGMRAPRATTIRGLTVRNASTGMVVDGVATIEDCWITGNSFGIRTAGGAVIRRNRIVYNGAGGLDSGADHIEGNSIANNGSRYSRDVRVQGRGFVFANNLVTGNKGTGSSFSGQGQIRNNIFHHNDGWEIDLSMRGVVEQNLIAIDAASKSPNQAGGGIRVGASSSEVDLELRQNTIVGTLSEGSALMWIRGAIPRVQLVNNIIAAAGSAIAVSCEGEVSGRQGRNLVFSENGSDSVGCGPAFAGDGTLVANPLFVAPQRGRYSLRPGSPAIDAGADGDLPATDLRSAPRVLDGNGDGARNVDLGAFELQPSVGPQPPSRSRASP